MEKIGIHGIYIENRCLFMVEKEGWDILPGGKRKIGELDNMCLEREVKEELSGSRITVGDYYGSFFGITPNSNQPLISKNYFIYFMDNIGEPSAEISRRKFVTSKDNPNLHLTEISRKVFDSLIKNDLID
jgi:ADP-ribose pyrophosphatase YjhB (NUDIX family)